MQVARIPAVRVADLADQVAFCHFAFRFVNFTQMSVKRLDRFARRQSVINYYDVPPTRPSVLSKNNLAICGCVNRLAAITISARVFVPVFAKMVIFAKILRVVPSIFVLSCSYAYGVADWICKAVGHLYGRRKRFGGVAGFNRGRSAT